MNKFVVLLWSVYILLSPIYLFKSGLPQIADISIAILNIILFISLMFKKKYVIPKKLKIVRVSILFSGYIFLVNFTWSIILSNAEINIHSLYYIYNICVFLDILYCYFVFGKRFVKFTIFLLSVSVFYQALAYVFLPTSIGRNAMFFNNPNQLGYYSLIVLSILAYNLCRINYYPRFSYIGLISSIYLSMLSLSRASMVGVVMMLIILLISLKNKILIILFFLCCAIGFISATKIYAIYSIPVINNSYERMLLIGKDSDDTLEKRGYDRIVNHKKYLIFGAGEGRYDRFFTDTSVKGELHSSIGTLIFSYGIIGFLIFIMMLFRIFTITGKNEIIFLIPVLFYGLTHQGLRFTHLWIYLSLIFIYGLCYKKKDHENN